MSELRFAIDSGVSLSKMRTFPLDSEINRHERPMFEVRDTESPLRARQEWTLFRVCKIIPAIDGNQQSVYAEVFVLNSETKFLPAGTLRMVKFNFPADGEGSITADLTNNEARKPILV